jgi:hypothetical protein
MYETTREAFLVYVPGELGCASYLAALGIPGRARTSGMWVFSYQAQNFSAGSSSVCVREDTHRTPGGILELDDYEQGCRPECLRVVRLVGITCIEKATAEGQVDIYT